MKKSEIYARNMLIKQYRKDHPEMSLEEIADHFNTSKQNISYILKKVNNVAVKK